MFKPNFYLSLQDSEFIAHIVSLALKLNGCHSFCYCNLSHCVCKLNFSADSGFCIFENSENFSREHASVKNRIKRKNFFGSLRFFLHVRTGKNIVVHMFNFERTVLVNVFGVNLFNAYNSFTVFTVMIDELFDCRNLACNNAVTVHNGKRFIAYKRFCFENGMSKAFHFFLSDKRNVCKV